jgi:lysophospholipase L1-like esterase
LNASNRYQYVLLQAPKSDVEHATPQDQYRQAITELIDLTREKGVKLVIATIPVPNDDPGSELSQKLEPYNQALREVAKTQRIPLADIHQAMADCYTKNPKSRLTLDGARFNRPGGMLMAETIMRALGLEERLTTELRKTWDERVFYGSRYQAQHGDQ